MRKLKIVLITSVVLLAIGGAFATTQPKQNCVYADQYYYVSGVYYPAGTFGYDYYCFNYPGTCTYYRPDPFNPNYYAPCRAGVYVYIP